MVSVAQHLMRRPAAFAASILHIIDFDRSSQEI